MPLCALQLVSNNLKLILGKVIFLCKNNPNPKIINKVLISSAYKQLQELEDPLVCEDVEDVPWDRVDNGQPVDLIFDEGVNRVKYTAKNKIK